MPSPTLRHCPFCGRDDEEMTPRIRIAFEATPDELASLPFNPVYAEVRLVPANGAGENLYGKGVGR